MTAPTVRILNGHVLDHLRELPDAFVHCVVTSPPYWGLRDYSRCECATNPGGAWKGTVFEGSGLGPMSEDPRNRKTPDPSCPKCHGTGKDESLSVIWDAKEGCEHEWGDAAGHILSKAQTWQGDLDDPRRPGKKAGGTRHGDTLDSDLGNFCRLCGAWHGQLGLEPTPELYVAHIVQVFQEVKRVLRDDGTLWLNMGDCYAGSWGAQSRGDEYAGTLEGGSMLSARQISEAPHRVGTGSLKNTPGLKPKDLIGMPWRVAFALQADGWYLRSDIIWAKPNPMPESVTDRPTKAHEYVFLLSKSARYYYDADAVREDWSESTLERALHHYSNPVDNPDYSGKQTEDYKKHPIAGSLITPKGAQRELDRLRTPERMGHGPGWRERSDRIVGRNLRTVWTIPTQPYPEAHFATFPEALAERCIRAGTSEKGCCAVCGAAWERVLEKSGGSIGKAWHDHREDGSVGQRIDLQDATHGRHGNEPYQINRIGFRPSCDHSGEPVPCVVLDPFGGSGTTGAVARGLGRSCILIEIKSQYNDLARERVRADLHPLEGYV